MRYFKIIKDREFDEERAAELLKDSRKLVTQVKDEKPATKKAKPKKQ